VAVARRLLEITGHKERVEFRVQDALQISQNDQRKKYNGIIAAMLAEHLEAPRQLFDAITFNLAEDGIAFFSTAIESAQRDHVHEFNLESEPIKMAEDAGLRVTRLICDATRRTSGARFLPRALAMVLRRR
jgi:2-polyprenyl-3-methyl-5-hydroxy-6-metoxy-1,4-benzoquinol methylase